jgi:nucleoside-diphosphate-sugar epimerase
MIAVVTGSTGFIGSHLVDALVARGATVRVITRPDSAAADGRVTEFRMDLRDASATRNSPVWEGATHVFHLAGVTKARTVRAFDDGNVVPLRQLLSAIDGRAAAPPHLILVSSQAAGGPATSSTTAIRETDRPSPVEEYGRSKLRAEQAALEFAERFPVSIVRPSSIYGPRDRDFLEVFRQASGRLAWHAVPPDHQFSLLHVADAVNGIIAAASRTPGPARVYYLAADVPVTWRSLYREISTVAAASPLELQLPASLLRAAAAAGDLIGALSGREFLLNRHKLELGRPKYWLCDPARAHSELGWHPQLTLGEGLAQTLSWYLGSGWLRRRGASPEPESSKEPRA